MTSISRALLRVITRSHFPALSLFSTIKEPKTGVLGSIKWGSISSANAESFQQLIPRFFLLIIHTTKDSPREFLFEADSYTVDLSHLIQSRREAQLIDKLQLIAGTGMKELAEQLSQLSRRSVDY